MEWSKLLIQGTEYHAKLATDLVDVVDGDMLDWKPAAENNWMTTGQLIKHLGSACGHGMKGFVTGDWGMPEGVDLSEIKPEDMLPPAEGMASVGSLAEAKELLAQDRALALEMIGKCSEEELETKLVAAPWDPTPLPLGRRLMQMIMHLFQHRCQLFYYLKLHGKPVHTGHLWGMM